MLIHSKQEAIYLLKQLAVNLMIFLDDKIMRRI